MMGVNCLLLMALFPTRLIVRTHTFGIELSASPTAPVAWRPVAFDLAATADEARRLLWTRGFLHVLRK